jgi:hypothetical protein
MAGGVPQLPGGVSGITNSISLLGSDVGKVAQMFGFGAASWGIYLKGKPAFLPDSIIAVDVKEDWRIADFPMENGAFQSYNKVRTPYEYRVTMTKAGGSSGLAAYANVQGLLGGGNAVSSFLQSVETAALSLNLYDVVTEDRTYGNACISHYDYRRTATNGADMVTVDLWLTEINQSVGTNYSNTQSPTSSGSLSDTSAPSGQDATNTGTVQPVSAAQNDAIQAHAQQTINAAGTYF